ncbi:MAG: IMPACT family protein [bacterium]
MFRGRAMTDAADPDRYVSLETGQEAEIRVQGSRFLARAFRADSESEADARLAEVPRLHWDATHHCWARRIGSPERCVERSDEGGEPSGTAGLPILAVLRGRALHDVLVVVTRWFGGTKLGKGGLARAYAEAARAAIDAAPRRTLWRESTVIAACDYGDVGAVEAVLARHADVVHRCERDFAGRPRFAITVRRSRAEDLCGSLREATGGRIELLPETHDGR